jgi:hypothetical protein
LIYGSGHLTRCLEWKGAADDIDTLDRGRRSAGLNLRRRCRIGDAAQEITWPVARRMIEAELAPVRVPVGRQGRPPHPTVSAAGTG